MAATTTTDQGGRALRAARDRVGLTRAQLAALVGCSLAQLANIEQGAVPKRSAVLTRAQAVLADFEPLTNEGPGHHPEAFEKKGDTTAHATAG